MLELEDTLLQSHYGSVALRNPGMQRGRGCLGFQQLALEQLVAGIQINYVTKTYLFFNWSGMSQRRIDDIQLHVGAILIDMMI